MAEMKRGRMARSVQHPEEAKNTVSTGSRRAVRTPSPALDVVEAFPFEVFSGGTAIVFGTVAADGFFDMTKAHAQLYGFGMGRSLSAEFGKRTGEDPKFDYRYEAQEVLDLMDALGLHEVQGPDPEVINTKYGDSYIRIEFSAK